MRISGVELSATKMMEEIFSFNCCEISSLLHEKRPYMTTIVLFPGTFCIWLKEYGPDHCAE